MLLSFLISVRFQAFGKDLLGLTLVVRTTLSLAEKRSLKRWVPLTNADLIVTVTNMPQKKVGLGLPNAAMEVLRCTYVTLSGVFT
jgi:hypothetical protein